MYRGSVISAHVGIATLAYQNIIQTNRQRKREADDWEKKIQKADWSCEHTWVDRDPAEACDSISPNMFAGTDFAAFFEPIRFLNVIEFIR